jgi:hypothetical protein
MPARLAALCSLLLVLLSAVKAAEATTIAVVPGGGGFQNHFYNVNVTIGWVFTLTSSVTVAELGYFDAGNDGLFDSHAVGIWTNGGTLQVSARPMQQLTGETIRVRPGSITAYTFDADSFRIAITASELTADKVALHVVFQTRGGGPGLASVFDVVTGAGFSAPTAALRDASGAFLKDKQGQLLFFEVSTTVRPNGQQLPNQRFQPTPLGGIVKRRG